MTRMQKIQKNFISILTKGLRIVDGKKTQALHELAPKCKLTNIHELVKTFDNIFTKLFKTVNRSKSSNS